MFSVPVKPGIRFGWYAKLIYLARSPQHHLRAHQRWCEKQGDTKMFGKSTLFLAAAIILGSAVAALANDQIDERGGFVIPDSMDGVNPVYHPDIFGSGGKPLGWAEKPTVQQDRSQSGKPAYTR